MSEQSAPDMHNVLSDLSRLAGTHLAELTADLCQTNDLLNAAIVHLMAEFNGLNQALEAQQALLATISPEYGAQLAALTAEIQSRVHGMVTGMQFEDMTKQLIGRSQSRVAGLAAMMSALEAGGQSVTCEQMQAQLRNSSSALFHSLQKSVGQQKMEGGDVELF